MGLWSYATGQRGINRIRVYERRPNGPLYVEWYDRDGRHQKALTSTNGGVPVLSKDLAVKIAERMSAAQRHKREAESAHKLLGVAAPRTLKELLDKHTKSNPHWSDVYARDQRVNRTFWLTRLGENTLLTDITPARVMQAVRDEARANVEGFGPRTQHKRLRYLKEAFLFARRDLKWITEADDLSPVKTSAVKGKSRPYSLDEVRALLPATEQVDLRLAVLCHLAWMTGRRANALSTLRASAYKDLGGVGEIQMPGETDKARKAGTVYVVGRTKELVERLLATPAVRSSGQLIPNTKTLEEERPKAGPMPLKVLTDMLRQAEKIAKVESQSGRAFHGLKRRFATEGLRFDPQAASKMSGTERTMLESRYEQDDPEAKAALARHLDSLLQDRAG